MNKNTVIALVIGLVVGIGGTVGATALVASGNESTPIATKTSTDHSMMSMNDMNKQLEGLSGDEFDKAFIDMMIAHHAGAVVMAEMADSRAKHDEVKQLSRSIITDQEQEISDMRQWQKDWGYLNDGSNSMIHSSH